MRGDRFILQLDLVDAEAGAIRWTEEWEWSRDWLLTLLPVLVERIVMALERQVSAAEARRAIALPRERLDAWGSFHAGLREAMRFDSARVDGALDHLRQATRLDPDFARAHAAQSLCHYFRAFAGLAADRAAEVAAARDTARAALAADDENPSSHWAYGRALWLDGDAEGCLHYARQSVALSSGYALGHYMIGFVEAHGGDPRQAVERMDYVLTLSPCDPFLGSVQITRALALLRLDEVEEAAVWAAASARQPNAYANMLVSAALILARAGRVAEGQRVVSRLRGGAGSARSLDRALSFVAADVAAALRRSAPLVGL